MCGTVNVNRSVTDYKKRERRNSETHKQKLKEVSPNETETDGVLAGWCTCIWFGGLLTKCWGGWGPPLPRIPRPEGSAETRGAKNPDVYVKVALVCGGAVNDGGWNASAYEGLQRIEETLGVETAYTEKVAVAEMPQVIRTYARQGFDLIFGHGAEFGEPMSTVAPEFPETTFVAVNANVEADNLTGTVFVSLGNAAISAAWRRPWSPKPERSGLFLPTHAPNNKADIDTYELGAKAVNPDIEVYTAFTGAWMT